MKIPNSLYTCAFCCKFNLSIKHCGSCLSILYCSRECQRLDWSFHKGFCKAFTSLGPRPSDGHSLAFYFPVDLDPRLEWVRRPDFLHPKANNRRFGFRSMGFMESKPTSQWPYILCRGGCRDDNLKLNHSVISFTRGAYWTGPLVVFRTGRPDIGSEVTRDILLDDLPRVIRWLRQISNGSRVMKPQVFKSSFNTSKCVILRCKGDYMNAPEETQLVASKVPELHPIFEGQPTNLSQLMGIPLIIQKIPREAGRDVAFDKDYLSNYYCGILHLDTLPHSETWGEIPSQWHENVGTVLVARQDKKDITTLQLLAIMSFIKLLDLREVEDEPDVKTKQKFLEGHFTRMKFEQFFFGRFAAASDKIPHLDGDLISPYSNSYDSIGISQNTSLVDRALDLWNRTGLRASYLLDD
ncbi:uncharacterized protein EAE98_002810 [Botrytis deweyae]|uniref:MYND-type domain-containing protein n=1 Tax=Botrytis deweyae TaxID=2478750 RepID=A0ABQ7IUX5_9HELO|nr:uncharacterized protein EAE98_002810 [Botrytis deweyae]KAF7934765.1 hypothetical protein EAE98_002810 [Botrytis deweyae]